MDEVRRTAIMEMIRKFGTDDIYIVLGEMESYADPPHIEQEAPRTEPRRKRRKGRVRAQIPAQTARTIDNRVLAAISGEPGITFATLRDKLAPKTSPEDIVKAFKRLKYRKLIRTEGKVNSREYYPAEPR